MKKVLILSGSPRKGGNSDTIMNCTLECFRDHAECLEGSAEKGVVYGKGAENKGDIQNSPAMAQACEMGLNV